MMSFYEQFKGSWWKDIFAYIIKIQSSVYTHKTLLINSALLVCPPDLSWIKSDKSAS